MKAEYLDHMGSDLTVVNAARVSFAKKSEPLFRNGTGVHIGGKLVSVPHLKEDDQRLIKYLAEHNHWSPFSHPQISIHLKMPFFVARQIDKHQIGFSVNEVSRRYVKSDPEFYVPDEWRKSAENVKQGSSDEPIDLPWLDIEYLDLLDHVEDVYLTLLDQGVCPEQARMILPMGSYTEQWKTGSLYAWARLYNQRTDPHAQKETRELAKQIGEIVEPLFPCSWKALTSV